MNEEKNVTEEIKAIRIVSDMTQAYDRHLKRMWAAVISLAACVVVMACCMVWAVSNAQTIANEAVQNAIVQSQKTMNDAVLSALEAVAEIGVTQETMTTTVTQDTGEGEGNNVYQAGEYATYEEGGFE